MFLFLQTILFSVCQEYYDSIQGGSEGGAHIRREVGLVEAERPICFPSKPQPVGHRLPPGYNLFGVAKKPGYNLFRAQNCPQDTTFLEPKKPGCNLLRGQKKQDTTFLEPKNQDTTFPEPKKNSIQAFPSLKNQDTTFSERRITKKSVCPQDTTGQKKHVNPTITG